MTDDADRLAEFLRRGRAAQAAVDDALIDVLTGELVGKQAAGPLELVVEPSTVFQLVGLVQLALRHPDVGPGMRADGEQFVTSARAYFADCPAVLDVIRRGPAAGWADLDPALRALLFAFVGEK